MTKGTTFFYIAERNQIKNKHTSLLLRKNEKKLHKIPTFLHQKQVSYADENGKKSIEVKPKVKTQNIMYNTETSPSLNIYKDIILRAACSVS